MNKTENQKKNIKNEIFLILIIFIILINLNFIFAADSFSGGYPSNFGGATYRVYGSSLNPQFNNPSFFSTSGFTSPEVYWPKYDKGDCYERQDFVMQIAPGGCSPAVVTSDLLEEQNVPVFCKVMAVQVNPLIDVSKIRSLRFSQANYPKGVSSISYFPAQAALRSQTSLINSPVKDNIGYLVIVLSRQQAEKDMPDFVQGNITAAIDYDAEGAFGIGNANFYISELNDEDWLRDYKQYGFWNGKGYIRADSIESDRAVISIYRDADSKQASVSLKKGETSKDIYLGGFYCAAGMNIKLENIDVPVDSALLQVNEQQIWVSKNDQILNGKCIVEKLDAYSGGGKVSLNCRVKNARFELSLTPGKALLNADGKDKEYFIGQKLREKDNWYLSYAGQDYKGKDFVVLINDNSSSNENEFADKEVYNAIEKVVRESNKEIDDKGLQSSIKNKIDSQYKLKLKTGDIFKRLDKEYVKILLIGESINEISLKEIFVAKDKDWSNDNTLAKGYYDEAVKNYEDLADLYPKENQIVSEDSYAAQGVYEAAQLSKNFEMKKKAQEFYDKLLNEYPISDVANKVKNDRELLIKYDSSQSKAVVDINGELYFFNLLDFKKPSRSDVSAVMLINGKEETLGLEEIREFHKEDKKLGSIQLKEIKDEYVMVRYFKPDVDLFGTGSENKKLGLNEQTLFNEINVKVLKINFNKQAKISINPKKFGPRTESNFSFKIGIEKRAIKLNPDKTKEVADNLADTIKKWSDVNNKLGEVIKGLKGACFATAATLTVKNLLSGLSGEAMARNALMTKQGGWNDICQDLVENKRAGKNGAVYSSIQSCLLDYNSEIQNDINEYTKAIDKTNNDLKKIQEELGPVGSDVLDFERQVDLERVRKAYYEKNFKSFYENNKETDITLSDNTKVKLKDIISADKASETSLDDMKNLITFNELRGSQSSVLGKVLNNQIGKDLLYTYQLNQENKQKDELIKTLGDYPVFEAEKGIKLQKMYEIKDSDSKLKSQLGNSAKMFIDSVPSSYLDDKIKGQKVEVGLVNEGGIYKINKAVTSEGVDVTNNINKYYSSKYGIDSFKLANPKAYQNKMANTGSLNVKYFERAPYKGLPAEVPFDVQNGWYVEMTYVLSGFGKPYDESGRAVNYYICNVGSNGKIEFKKSADDICRYYNGDVNSLEFPGMTKTESAKLVSQAQSAIAEAGRQYPPGSKGVKIGNQVFKSAASFAGEDGKCSDFMSPSDCNIMFNVCDPVICPASRCDLGGSFRVDNVIQTGILGSLVLCLPNIREGIFVPICLSGVHAGIEGYLSVLNQTHACLKESLETGRNVGICDQITSIYLCEFFWKQATPFINVLIPRLIESFYSQGTRGGGEYLTVQAAWDNTQNAISYFKNEYAINSMQAFTARSTEEAGTEVCKSFTSIAYPNSKEFLDKLLEPDSPVQYTGWFSEDTLTTATIPSTSHYKVYYHIYSGKDQGAYYLVYLKDLPASNYIYLSGIYNVDSGYVSRGSQIDMSKDFTAVSGYKQLCISVNGQEQCGFGKVSTAYSLNKLSDEYAAEQIQTGIKKETECIAGTPSALSLVSLNVQQGAEEIVNPELYKHGIIRVCSTQNPGKQVLSNGEYDSVNSTYDRWKQVGYCDDTTIKCWLDTSSVKNAIQDLNIEKEALQNIDLSILGEGYLTEESGRNIASEAENEIKNLKVNKNDDKKIIDNKILGIADKLNRLINLGVSNVHRARGYYLLANLYKKVAEQLYTGIKVTSGSSDADTSTKIPTETIIGTKSETLQQRAKQNPQDFVYKIYERKTDSYIFYIYNESNRKWMKAVSKDTNFNWKNNLANFKNTNVIGLAGIPGLETLITMYSDDNYVFYYIEKANGIVMVRMKE
jgi:hypothetical protein